MRRGDANDGAVEVPERLIRDNRRDLRAPTTKPRIFFDCEQATRFGDGAEDGPCVQRDQRAHVDDFGVDAMFALQNIRRFERTRDHERKRDNGAVAACAQNLGCAQRIDDLAIGDFPLHGVERLVLMEDDGIVVPDRRGHQAHDIGG